MKIISIALLLLILQKAVAQKKLIDNYSYKSWVSLRSYGISSDGKYVWYNYGSHETGNSLVIVSSDGKTRKEVVGADGATFTADSRFIIFNHPNGIGVLDVQRDIQIIEGSSFQIPCKGKGQWMTYRAGVNLLLRNLHSEEEHRYEKVNECWFNEDGSVLILKKDSGLTWIALPAKKEQHLYHGKAPRNIAFDKSGKQVAFIAEMKGEQQLCYYRIGMDSAIILATPAFNWYR